MQKWFQSTAAIFTVFFVESAVLGSWIPRIPDIKAQLQLSDFDLGLCLLSMPLGTLFGLMVAGRFLGRFGLRKGCQVFLPLWAGLFMLVAFATNAYELAGFLLICGLSVGLIEVAMNTKADQMETSLSKRIMSRCHGFWSLGSMAGALLGGTFAHFGVSVIGHFIIVLPLLALLGWYAASALPEDTESEELTVNYAAPNDSHTDEKSEPFLSLPSSAILLLCIMPMGAMVIEGAFIDWSAVFMRSELQASPLTISVAYSFFAVVMAIVRLSGDSIAERFGDFNVMRISGLAASAGIALFAMAPNVTVAFLGAALSGMGVAIVYPLAVTAAARRSSGTAAENVAALTMVSFSAFLLAPPLIGFASEAFGLRWALLALMPIAFTTFLLAAQVKPQS